MRIILFCLVFIALAPGLSAQIDAKKESNRAIPAIISPKDSIDTKKILPEKPKQNNDFDGVTAPKITSKLKFPKKEFSMFPEEEFGNPGELYSKRLTKLRNEALPEGHGENSGLKENAYWGDYRTKAKYVIIRYRDYGIEDGDFLGILYDDDFIRPRELLTSAYRGFKLPLKEGFNKIDFLALNEGDAIPNTAHYEIYDDQNNLITGKIWALSTGVKVTVIIIKE